MNPMTKIRYAHCPSVRQAGMSLVEMMIALTIGLILLLGISTLIVQQNTTRSEIDKSSRQIENGRYAMQLLHDDIQLAGFYGEYSPAKVVTTSIPSDAVNGVANAIPSNPCDTSVSSLGFNAATPKVPVAIYGYAGGVGDPTAGSCLDHYLDNTAVLVIRRVSTVTTPVASAAANTIYLQVSTCTTDATPFVLGTSGYTLLQKDCTTLAVLRPYIVRIYFISSCTVCGSDNIPTLKIREIIGGIASTIPLVEGIQNMQFDYGLDGHSDNDGGGTMDDINGDSLVDVLDLDGVPDIYTSTPAAPTWPNVMAVRVNLLARNNDTTKGHLDGKTYKLGGAGTVGPFNDTYKRHAYSQLVRVINPSGRRE